MSEQRTRVKICGLTNLEDARFASGAMADYLGFIFYEGSPRHIDPAEAGAIRNWIEGIPCVGVFVNQPMDDVNMIARQTGVDLVQLHGNESPEYCSLLEKPVIKVIHVEEHTTAGELSAAVERYREVADHLMFDNRSENQWGGTGDTFDWSLLDELSGEVPYFLAGGLTPENVAEACRTVRPAAVDVNSGVEAEGRPGVKDYDKIEALMNQMRSL